MSHGIATMLPPRLRIDLNLSTLSELPEWSCAPRGSAEDILRAIRDAGYEGVQDGDPALARRLGLGCTTTGRIDRPDQVEPQVRAWRDAGHELATVHVGSGHEDDSQLDDLADAIIGVSAALRFPVLIETHRATATQDTWRTVQWIRRKPGLRFNADFSHWYSGLEMRYGDWEAKLAFLAPIFARVGYFHGRVGNGSQIQVALDDPSTQQSCADFSTLWTRAMAGFLDRAQPGDWIGFAPELLPASIDYARRIPLPTGFEEESDRWLEALRLAAIARACFAHAQARAQALTVAQVQAPVPP